MHDDHSHGPVVHTQHSGPSSNEHEGWTILDPVKQNAQILAVHAALLHTGKIIYFGGDEHDQGQNQHYPPQINNTRFFDCETEEIINTGCSPTFDVFCCGHSLLADGRLLVAGGTDSFPPGHSLHHDHFAGLHDAAIFDTGTCGWRKADDLCPEPGKKTGGGRWYPTLLTLSDGSVLAMGGHPARDDTRHSNNSPERFDPTDTPYGKWKLLTGPEPDHTVADYPRLHLLRDGSVFSSTPTTYSDKNECFVVKGSASGCWTHVCDGPPDSLYYDIPTTSVLLPLNSRDNYTPRILICGAKQPYVIEPLSGNPKWKPTAPRTLMPTPPLVARPPRRYGNAVLLPTGEVFISGGVSVEDNMDTSAVMEAELYRPQSDEWITLSKAQVPRNYHSVALLLPDGRIWTAGSNINAQQSFSGDPPATQPAGWGNRELRIEIYEPDYCRAPRRPYISGMPEAVQYHELFTVKSPEAEEVSRVAILRTGSVTHGFNADQRYIELQFECGPEKDELTVETPPDGNVAPPGYYLLFLLNAEGIPSVGRFIRIGPK